VPRGEKNKNHEGGGENRQILQRFSLHQTGATSGHDVPRNGDGLLTRAGGGGAERNWAEGRAMTLEQAIEYALRVPDG